VSVDDGVVTISGRVECGSAVPGLVTAALEAEGVIQLDEHITYDADDRYPIAPTFWGDHCPRSGPAVRAALAQVTLPAIRRRTS
jgi:hypothetical protein